MSVRISGVTIPNEKRVVIGLTYIFGIGRAKSAVILEENKIDPNIRVKNLTEEQVNILRKKIEKSGKIEGDLKREIIGNIKRLKEINCYRGSRHTKKLPARGQRTKTNNRTVRGNVRRTSVSGRKVSAQKT